MFASILSGTAFSTGENKHMQSQRLNQEKGIWHLFSSDYIKTGRGLTPGWVWVRRAGRESSSFLVLF